MKKIGILLTNTGTPDAPTPKAVKRYLKEFLSDRNVVRIPRLIWLPLLHGLILPLRSKKSALLYKKIWKPSGSPLRTYTVNLATALQNSLNQQTQQQYHVLVGMNYGSPSIKEGLQELSQQGVSTIIVLPLFPQYSSTTTASSCERALHFAKTITNFPNLKFIKHYSNRTPYIQALAESIRSTWNKSNKKQHLLISFHGIPERFAKDGDPYQQQCEHTAKLLATTLELAPNQWTLCYQSRFGYAAWLKPSTQDLFKELPQRGIKHVDIICPGFASDCLETLEEIAITGKESFLEAGGESFRYIPALNDTPLHVEMFTNLIISGNHD